MMNRPMNILNNKVKENATVTLFVVYNHWMRYNQVKQDRRKPLKDMN